MPAYKFLGISDSPGGHGYKQADALIHGTDGKQISFNDKLFLELTVGQHFVMDRHKSYPENPVTVIAEEEIPGILKQDKEDQIAAQAAYEKRKADNIATGRFKYFYTPFRDRQAENIDEFLSDKSEDFGQILVDIINSGERVSGRPRETKITVEQFKQDKRNADFLALVKPGDKLMWYSWDGGPLAYSAGPMLMRDEVQLAYQAWIVS